MFQSLNLHSVRRHNCTYIKLDLFVLSESERETLHDFGEPLLETQN